MQILKGQLWQLIFLSLLIAILSFISTSKDSVLEGELLRIPTIHWFWIAILAPILHQLYVMICWRVELFYKGISDLFGDKGFKVFKVGFAILIFSRLMTIILLSLSNANTLNVNQAITLLLSAVFTIPVVYLIYSIHKHFKIDRAFGIDHFYPEKLKNEVFVKKGIFKYSSNAMYVFGFLALYIPGLLLQSEAAIVVALFNHLYIWVHYYCTELPDIRFIYQD